MLFKYTFQKIFALVLIGFSLVTNVTLASSTSNLWAFDKSERIVHFIPNPTEGNLYGMKYTCNSFNPSFVSLLIFYQGKSPLISTNPEAFVHNKILNKNPIRLDDRGFMLIRNVSRMSIVLSFDSKYHISNFTGVPIEGLDCTSLEVSNN